MSSGVLVTYKEQNKFDKYYVKTTAEKADINDVVSMFMKELTTIKGSSLFDRNYGTTFIDDISGQVNIYKVRWFLENKYNDTLEKYGIVKVWTEDATMNTHNGFLEIRLKIHFEEFALEHYETFLYNGTYTTETIIEMD